MFRGLELKIALLTLIPLLFVSSSISAVAIYSKYQSERQSLIDRLVAYRSLLESGNLSFDTVQNKAKLKGIVGEDVVLAEILRSDYSVVFSSENSAAPLITEDEQYEVDQAFLGIETITSMKTEGGGSVLSIITPLVVNQKIVAVLHQQLSNFESSARVASYGALVMALMFFGLVICFFLVYALLGRVIVRNIQRLKEATVEIQKGKLEEKIDITTRDEIGELAASFNMMTDRLLKSRRHIESKVKELSEEHGKLSSLVESVKLGVVMVDLRLNVILSNGAAREIFNKPEGSLDFRDVVSKIKGKVNISQALSYYVHSGKPLNVQEVMIGEKYYRFFMSPVRDINDKVFIGAVMVIEDITEQKKIDQMRTEIVSITSHQLRTPATIVKGNLEMVLHGDVGKISKEQKEVLNDVYMGNERMIHLINDLMDAAKINEGKIFLPLEVLDLADLAKEVVEENRLFAEEKKVKISFVDPPHKLDKVEVNRQKVKQVFQNLVDNAIKYSAIDDKGEVKVVIEDIDGSLRLVVKDNGIGIPKADQGKIFERFARGSNSTKLDPGGGSGLGLYIAKAVIEQGGGRIWFETEEGAGTTFYATFPKHKKYAGQQP